MGVQEGIDQRLRQAIADKVTPGASVSWSTNTLVNTTSIGKLSYEPEAEDVSSKTLYDAASITKSIPLALLVHIALQEGRITLDTLVKQFIPEMSGEFQDLITVKHLLTYTAVWDIPQGLAFVANNSSSYQQVLDRVYSAPLMEKPGVRHFYANTPALVLTVLIERLYRDNLSSLARRYIFDPLNITSATFAPDLFSQSVAPTEVDESGNWVQAVVHDETARLALGDGIHSGNAGLFINSADLGLLMQQICVGSDTITRLFTDETRASWTENYALSADIAVALGWELCRPVFMGKYTSPTTFGKTGFTGCVVIAQPETKRSMSLLMNAQFPSRHKDRVLINALRCDLADIVFNEDYA